MAGSAVLSPDPARFDAVAAGYDATFTDTRLGTLLRERVWEQVGDALSAGDRVLDLACGTGADAVWMAKRGAEVHAVDGSAAMVELTARRSAAAGLERAVTARHCALADVGADGVAGGAGTFDGVLANFGGLNALPSVAGLAGALGELVRPGGWLVAVPMGPWCPWEVAHFVVRGRPRTALRRVRRGPAAARVGHGTIPVWYPSARRLAADLSPWFAHRSTRSLGLLLPPTYAGGAVERWPRAFGAVARIDRRLAPLAGGIGDHYIARFERA